MLGSILSWILIGAIAGAIGKAIMPGHQGGGIIATILLGIIGALVGGFIGNSLFGVGVGLSISGIFMAVLGSMIVIFVYESFAK